MTIAEKVALATLKNALRTLNLDPDVRSAAYILAQNCGMDLNKHKKTIKTLFKPDKIPAVCQDAPNKEIILFTSLLFRQPEKGLEKDLEKEIRDNSILTSMGDMFNYGIQPQDLYDFLEAFDSACRFAHNKETAASLIQAVENMREKVTVENGPKAQTLYEKLNFLAQGLTAINQGKAEIKNHVKQVREVKKREEKLKTDVKGFYNNIENIKEAIAPNQPSQEAQSPKEPGPQPSPKEPDPQPIQEAQSPPPSPKKPDPQPTRPPEDGPNIAPPIPPEDGPNIAPPSPPPSPQTTPPPSPQTPPQRIPQTPPPPSPQKTPGVIQKAIKFFLNILKGLKPSKISKRKRPTEGKKIAENNTHKIPKRVKGIEDRRSMDEISRYTTIERPSRRGPISRAGHIKKKIDTIHSQAKKQGGNAKKSNEHGQGKVSGKMGGLE